MGKLKKSRLLAAYEDVVEPLKNHTGHILREKARRLKQADGESWAIGEVIERACILRDAIKVDAAK